MEMFSKYGCRSGSLPICSKKLPMARHTATSPPMRAYKEGVMVDGTTEVGSSPW